jgi:Ca2+/Na+ antiporter
MHFSCIYVWRLALNALSGKHTFAVLSHLQLCIDCSYFCASLTLAVDILKLSPNVAGVTFLAVGNAACDVIASIAAFSTGVPKVGIGTTVGAGIFVTTAVIAVVSFVADVRLARRSFVRDILFFMFTVVYLLVVSADGFIDLGESVGFIVIYIVFVLVVGGARYIRLLHSPEEDAHGLSLAGSTGEEGSARRLSVEIMDAKFDQAMSGGTYNAPVEKPQLGLVADNRDRSISDVRIMSRALDHDVESAVPDMHKDMLHALDAARAQALEREREKDMKKLKNAKYFARAEAEGTNSNKFNALKLCPCCYQVPCR